MVRSGPYEPDKGYAGRRTPTAATRDKLVPEGTSPRGPEKTKANGSEGGSALHPHASAEALEPDSPYPVAIPPSNRKEEGLDPAHGLWPCCRPALATDGEQVGSPCCFNVVSRAENWQAKTAQQLSGTFGFSTEDYPEL